MARVSICVGAVRGATVRDLVRSILLQDYPDWELILVAQGQEGELLAAMGEISGYCPKIRVIHTNRFGLSVARNTAAAAATGEVLAFTDDDCEAAPNWLSVIMESFSDQEIGIVGGNLVPSRSRSRNISSCPAAHVIEYKYNPKLNQFVAPYGFYWVGGNFAVRRKALEAIGPFDQYLGAGTEFPSAEDVDFALRAEEQNVVTYTTPRSVVHHTHGRRYGMAQFIKHHRNYALGRGALLAKLELWGHRLSVRWSIAAVRRDAIYTMKHNPVRGVMSLHDSYYIQVGRRSFARRYFIGPDRLSYPIGMADPHLANVIGHEQCCGDE